MKKIIDISKWKRREHFEHFKKFEDPYFGLTVNFNVTNLYRYAKRTKESFFVHYFFQIMKAVNSVDEFKYRIENDDVVCYDTIHASSTIGRSDGTFAFCSFDYSPDFKVFNEHCKIEIDIIQKSEGLYVNTDKDRLDIIYFSPVPWLQFTDMKHPMQINKEVSVPLISVGKYFESEGKILMPISISGNHALMDGYHIAQFIKILEDNISNLE